MKTHKSILFEILRWLVAAMLVVMLVMMFGGDRISSADPQKVTDAVTAAVDMSQVLEGDNQMIKRLYGLDPGSYEFCALYYPSTNMVAEEVLVIKLKDLSQQDAVRNAVEARLKTQKTTFDGYGIEQFDMLTNNSVIEIRGNFVLFLVNAKSAEGQQAFLDAL